MHGIVLEGESAVEERQRLLEDGKEILVDVSERDARGKTWGTKLHLGMNQSVAWVFCQKGDGEQRPKSSLDEVLAQEAKELFQTYIDRLVLRQGLVNSSPLSPEFCEVSPDTAHLIDCIKGELGIELSV